MRQVNVSTTGTPSVVTLNDLGGFVLAHPQTNFDLLNPTTGGGFTIEDVMYSQDLKAAIDSSALIVTDEFGYIITDPLTEFSSDVKAKISATDTRPDYLQNKLQNTTGKTALSITGSGANEKLVINVGADIFDKTVDDTDDISEGAAKKFVSADQKAGLDLAGITALNRPLVESDKGATNGVASLVGGKVPTSQLPDAILGQLSYISTWNATTNTPTIPPASSSNKGNYYVVSVAGSTTIDGISDWQVGDWIVSNGTAWEKVDNTDSVTSVAGKTGAVTLQAADITDFDTEVSNNTDVAANTTHRGRTDNPHNVTAAQVGNTTAQWNANQIQGQPVDATAPATGDILVFDGTQWSHPQSDAALTALRYFQFSGGRNGNQNNGYLQNSAGGAFFNEAQYVVPFDATIIAITGACTSGVNDWRAEIRSELNPSFIASVSLLSTEVFKNSNALSVNVNAGERLSLFLQKGPGGSGSGNNIPNPSVVVYLRRR